MSRGLAIVFSLCALLTGCQAVDVFDQAPPDSVTYRAVLRFDQTGALVESTGIEPHRSGEPIQVVSASSGTTLIVGYTDGQIARSFEDDRFVPNSEISLNLALDCDRSLDGPEWAVQWRPGEDAVPASPSSLPPLTTEELRALGPTLEKPECLECPELIVEQVEELEFQDLGHNWVLGPDGRLHAWGPRGRYAVDLDGAVETLGPQLTWSAAVPAVDNLGWAARRSREIGRFDFEDFELDVVATATGSDAIWALEAHPDAEREELLALAQSGEVVRFRDDALIELFKLEFLGSDAGAANFEFVDADTALLAVKDQANIYILSGDEHSIQRPIEGAEGYADIERIEGHGVLISYERGALVRFEAGSFETLSQLENPVGEMVPFAGGILGGAWLGPWVSYIRPDLRQCPVLAPVGPRANLVRDLIPAGPNAAYGVAGLANSGSVQIFTVRVAE